MKEDNKNKSKDNGSRHSASLLTAFTDNESVLRKFLRRFTSNAHDIEDITQETILRALKAEKTQEIHQPRAFLFGVARNVAMDQLRKKSRSIVDFMEDFGEQEHVSSEPSLEESLDSRQRMLIFAEAVAALPEQCQKVFVLKRVYGYSHQEISKKLGISISTIEKHAAAGLKKCNEFMDRRLNEGESPAESSVSDLSKRSR